jgi:hypothetical protein
VSSKDRNTDLDGDLFEFKWIIDEMGHAAIILTKHWQPFFLSGSADDLLVCWWSETRKCGEFERK